MPTFKEQMQRDAKIFLNPDEFGEIMNINGQDITALWGKENTPTNAPDAWGVNTESAVLVIAENAMPLPVPDQRITVNGQDWKVRKATPQDGLLRLEMERNTS